MRKVDVLGVRVDDIDKVTLEQKIVECVERGRKEVFAYANVHAINIARENQRFREFVNAAAVLYCDGEGVRLGARILGVHLPPRTVLTRWIWDLGALFQEKGISTFLLGGRSERTAFAANRWSGSYPGLKLVGYHHGYFNKAGGENSQVLDLINRAGPNVLFVGFGMPEQELWIKENLDHLKVNAVLPCGGMIDYLSAESPVAPAWMSNNGMEWFHRLMQDPARQWKRYLLGNPMFLFRIFRQRLTGGRPS